MANSKKKKTVLGKLSRKITKNKNTSNQTRLMFFSRKGYSHSKMAALIVVLVAIGGVVLYFAHASTAPGSPWDNLSSLFGCPLNSNDLPSTISQANNPTGNRCTQLAKYVLKDYANQQVIGAVDTNFGAALTTAVKNLQTFVHIIPATGIIDGTTWGWIKLTYVQNIAPSPGSPGACVNPVAGEAATPQRTDRGVDYDIENNQPVRAICSGIIQSLYNSGWPGGAYIQYKLTSYPSGHPELLNKCIYMAEHITPTVSIGTPVKAGDVIGYANGSQEWGWSTNPGVTSSPKNTGADLPTLAGNAMARFLRSLGAPTGYIPSPVSGPFVDGTPCP